MSKKDLKITIDEKILEKGKNTITNLSAFFEECLKHYLGYADGTIPVGNVNEITDKIGKLQAELYLINQNYDVQESMKQVENEEKDRAWRFLWNDYRVRLIPDEILMKKAVEQLGKNEEELEDILDWVHITDIRVNTNSWQDVLEKYEKY